VQARSAGLCVGTAAGYRPWEWGTGMAASVQAVGARRRHGSKCTGRGSGAQARQQVCRPWERGAGTAANVQAVGVEHRHGNTCTGCGGEAWPRQQRNERAMRVGNRANELLGRRRAWQQGRRLWGSGTGAPVMQIYVDALESVCAH